jgi:hypothetical protein
MIRKKMKIHKNRNNTKNFTDTEPAEQRTATGYLREIEEDPVDMIILQYQETKKTKEKTDILKQITKDKIESMRYDCQEEKENTQHSAQELKHKLVSLKDKVFQKSEVKFEDIKQGIKELKDKTDLPRNIENMNFALSKPACIISDMKETAEIPDFLSEGKLLNEISTSADFFDMAGHFLEVAQKSEKYPGSIVVPEFFAATIVTQSYNAIQSYKDGDMTSAGLSLRDVTGNTQDFLDNVTLVEAVGNSTGPLSKLGILCDIAPVFGIVSGGLSTACGVALMKESMENENKAEAARDKTLGAMNIASGIALTTGATMVLLGTGGLAAPGLMGVAAALEFSTYGVNRYGEDFFESDFFNNLSNSKEHFIQQC